MDDAARHYEGHALEHRHVVERLESTAITSADLPDAIVPTSSERSSSLAALTVAALIASRERIPASTMKPNSRAFCPWGPTPMSLPKGIVTPASGPGLVDLHADGINAALEAGVPASPCWRWRRLTAC